MHNRRRSIQGNNNMYKFRTGRVGQATAAKTDRKPLGDVVQSLCWCGKRYVEVSLEAVRSGETISCGKPECERNN